MNNFMHVWFKRALILILSASLVGCSSMSGTSKGGVLGGLLGGTLGGLIGKRTGNTAAGVILGAAVGGVAGAAIGRYMDKQAAELERELKNARVERVGEGIKITFDSGILFDIDKAELRSQAQDNLTELATVLKKYKDTEILVQGHTDSTGSESYNQKLSEKRAAKVAEYIVEKGVNKPRLTAVGYGEELPQADNATSAGRQQNRRVEVAIFANEELKEAAEAGKIG